MFCQHDGNSIRNFVYGLKPIMPRAVLGRAVSTNWLKFRNFDPKP